MLYIRSDDEHQRVTCKFNDQDILRAVYVILFYKRVIFKIVRHVINGFGH